MNKTETSYYLRKLKRKYLIFRLSEISLLSLSGSCIVYGFLILVFHQSFLYFGSAALIGIVIFITGMRLFKLHHLNELRFISFINERYPQLEYSVDLLLKKNAYLTSLEQVQRERTIEKFNALYPLIRLPNHLGRASIIFSISLLATLILVSFNKRPATIEHRTFETVEEKEAAKLPTVIKKVSITVTPPYYTGLIPSTSENPQLIIPEGSRVDWAFVFTDSILNAHLVFSGKDSAELDHRKNDYSTSRTFTRSGFYQIIWKGESGKTKTSDYYTIEVLQDQAPEITITSLKQATNLTINDNLSIPVKATIKDDYTISDTYIIATVSKGSGESVKFREEKIKFSSLQKIQGKNVNASHTIDLLKLGLEPGDELYFYVEAADNKQPLPNLSRTETYFITLQDTASENSSMDAGLGVDLMPEYFRSQRQIIIDTEKLLKQKNHLSRQAFNFTSNELGYEQKVLRLKYGEFLGEEFESEIVRTEDPLEDPRTNEKELITEKFGHVHDKDNEHNLVDRKKTEDEHQHNNKNDPEKVEDPLQAFKHLHDNTEEATFFTQSIRTKLKAALTVMWDAELHLRLNDPKKSLPYQYQALKLLKEISYDSRVYVHKTGFDPPPVKENKRLLGDLTEIKGTQYQRKQKVEEKYPDILKALSITDNLLQQHTTKISEKDKAAIFQAGSKLSTLALEQPGNFLPALSLIKALYEDEIKEDKITQSLIQIRKSLWLALLPETISPNQQVQTHHELDKLFIKNLEELNHE